MLISFGISTSTEKVFIAENNNAKTANRFREGNFDLSAAPRSEHTIEFDEKLLSK